MLSLSITSFGVLSSLAFHLSYKFCEQQKYYFWQDAIKKIKTIIFFVSITTVCFARVSDDFSDGEFSNNPVWSGSTSQCKVNSSNQPQLSFAGKWYLSTALVVDYFSYSQTMPSPFINDNEMVSLERISF